MRAISSFGMRGFSRSTRTGGLSRSVPSPLRDIGSPGSVRSRRLSAGSRRDVCSMRPVLRCIRVSSTATFTSTSTRRGVSTGCWRPGPTDGVNFADWKAALQDDDEYASSALACLDLLQHGYTGFVDGGTAFSPDAVAAAARATGIRGWVADPYLWDRRELMDHVPSLISRSLEDRVPFDTDRALRRLGAELRRNSDPDALVRGYVALYGLGTASDELQRAAKDCANRHRVAVIQHVGYTARMTQRGGGATGTAGYRPPGRAGRPRRHVDARSCERRARRRRSGRWPKADRQSSGVRSATFCTRLRRASGAESRSYTELASTSGSARIAPRTARWATLAAWPGTPRPSRGGTSRRTVSWK